MDMSPISVRHIQSDHPKDIGVIIDCKLNFEHHITAKINNIDSIPGVTHRIFQCKDERNLDTLFQSLVRSHLEFVIQVQGS